MKLTVYSMQNCQPCKQVKQSLSELSLGEIAVEEVDVYSVDREQLMQLNVKGAPTLIFYDDQGNEVSRKTGLVTKKQLEVFLGLDD